MKTKQNSIFNLIEIFGRPQRATNKRQDSLSHCEEKYHHDFYCDAEKPFISI